MKFIQMLEERGIETLDQMNHFGAHNAEAIRKMPSYHVIVLAKNDIGRVNLYTLISKSHLEYFWTSAENAKERSVKIQRGSDDWKCL